MSAIDLRTTATGAGSAGAAHKDAMTSLSDQHCKPATLNQIQIHQHQHQHHQQQQQSAALFDGRRRLMEQHQVAAIEQHDNEVRLWQLAAMSAARNQHEMSHLQQQQQHVSKAFCAEHKFVGHCDDLQTLMLARLQHQSQQEALLAKQLSQQSLNQQHQQHQSQQQSAFEQQQQLAAMKSQQEQLNLIQRLNLLQQQQINLNQQLSSERNQMTQRMIIDEAENDDNEDDDNEDNRENEDHTYSNDDDVMMMQEELIEAQSKSSAPTPRNLKKSFIKRYRKFLFFSSARRTSEQTEPNPHPSQLVANRT